MADLWEGYVDKDHPVGLQCHRCGTANRAARKFCANCGAGLWEPCLRCGALSPASERFCGGCGADLVAIVQEEIDRFEMDLASARHLQSQGRFEEAIELLRGPGESTHPGLADCRRRANEEMARLASELDRSRRTAEAAYQEAQEWFSCHDYQGARQILESVPAELRNKEHTDLLRQTRNRLDEISALTEQLGEAAQAGRIDGLLSKAERLLDLQPAHAGARRLAQDLQRRLCRAAERRLAAHRYDEASRLLRELPQHGQTAEAEELRQRAQELAFLAWDLRHAPVADQTLLAIGERLCKLAPSDEEAKRLVGELRRRVSTAAGRAQNGTLPWARPPKSTQLGTPITAVTGLPQFGCDASFDHSLLETHPGRFFVACGLALQGMERAPLPINLLPADRRGMLGKVKRMALGSRARAAWGIDLSTSGLKAVKLAAEGRDGRLLLADAVLIEHRKILSQAAGQQEEDSLVRETLDQFISQRQLRGERICVGLPGQLALRREIQLPPMDPAKAARAMPYQLADQFPIPAQKLVWGYALLEPCPGDPAQDKRQRALLVAVKRVHIEQWLTRFEQFRLRVDLVQCDPLAIHNYLAHVRSQDDDAVAAFHAGQSETVAVLDLGANSSNVIVSSPDSVWFRNIGLGTHSFVRALVQEFKLTVAHAEELLRRPTLADRLSTFYETLKPVFQDLLQEVQESLDAFSQAHPEETIQGVLGMGGGFQVHGLLRYLQTGR